MEEPPQVTRATWGCYGGMVRAIQPPGIFYDRSFDCLNPTSTNGGSRMKAHQLWSSVVYRFSRPLIMLEVVTTAIHRDASNTTKDLRELDVWFELVL